jgi:hypothetical protein
MKAFARTRAIILALVAAFSGTASAAGKGKAEDASAPQLTKVRDPFRRSCSPRSAPTDRERRLEMRATHTDEISWPDLHAPRTTGLRARVVGSLKRLIARSPIGKYLEARAARRAAVREWLTGDPALFYPWLKE